MAEVDLALSDQSELRALREWFRATPGVDVAQRQAVPAAGEQGALDWLTLLASSSVLVAAIQVIPEFLRSRRSGLTVTMKVKGQDFSVTATNVDDVMPILQRLLDAE